jgi:hypothetical protein
MRSPVADLLADLGTGLNELDVPWYLFGARAAILYGLARLTADVDVTVRLPRHLSTEAFTQQLESRGFLCRVMEPGFIERTSVVPFVHTASALPLDVVLAGPGLEDQFFERVIVRTIDGVRVPVASAEDLVVMKVLAGRPKDLEDIVAITAAQRDAIDVAYIRATLGAIEQAIGQSDLLPVFERTIASSRCD